MSKATRNVLATLVVVGGTFKIVKESLSTEDENITKMVDDILNYTKYIAAAYPTNTNKEKILHKVDIILDSWISSIFDKLNISFITITSLTMEVIEMQMKLLSNTNAKMFQILFKKIQELNDYIDIEQDNFSDYEKASELVDVLFEKLELI